MRQEAQNPNTSVRPQEEQDPRDAEQQQKKDREDEQQTLVDKHSQPNPQQ